MFDTSKQIEVQIMSGVLKRCTVRWPSDQEWIRRADQQFVRDKAIGRGRSEPETFIEQADATLLAKIRVASDDEFDEYEAAEVIKKLESCRLKEDPEVVGEQVTIRFAAMLPAKSAIPVTHTLKLPTRRQVEEYRRQATRITNNRGTTEYRANLKPAERLYEEMLVEHEGYAGSVPIIHKDAAVAVAMNEADRIQREMDGLDSPEV